MQGTKKSISTWFKNKDKILSSLEEGQNIKWLRFRGAAHDALSQAGFKWFPVKTFPYWAQ